MNTLVVLFWLISTLMGSGDLDFRSVKITDGNGLLIVDGHNIEVTSEGYFVFDGELVRESQCGFALDGRNIVQLHNAVDSIWCMINGCGGWSEGADCDWIKDNLGIDQQAFLGLLLLAAVKLFIRLLIPVAKVFRFREITYTCKCSREGEFDVTYNVIRVWDEVKEFVEHPCYLEFSDIMINISCLMHALVPTWKWLLPGAWVSQLKGVRRYCMWGCCRSFRNASVECLYYASQHEEYRYREFDLETGLHRRLYPVVPIDMTVIGYLLKHDSWDKLEELSMYAVKMDADNKYMLFRYPVC